MAQAISTIDHATIRKWAEQRGGRPSRVTSTGKGDDPGILRIDFGDADASLEEISWDEFFDKFEESQLALLYQDEDEAGHRSRFNKLIDRKQQ